MSSYTIGLIAEDDTDCDTIRKIIHRVIGQEVSTKKWASKGCSALKRKLEAKLKNMLKSGCDVFIIIHDLDRNPLNGSLNDENQLRRSLEASASILTNPKKCICIPAEELEAWFWSDQRVVEYIGRGKGRAHPNPQSIIKPKEKLIELSAGENRKPRYSTNMNALLAEMLDLDECSACCPSFKELLDFLRSL